MSRAAYVGVADKACKVKEIYIGVDDVTRRVLKGYIGDENGIARQFWPPYDDGSPKKPYKPPVDPPPDILCPCQNPRDYIFCVPYGLPQVYMWNSYYGEGGQWVPVTDGKCKSWQDLQYLYCKRTRRLFWGVKQFWYNCYSEDGSEITDSGSHWYIDDREVTYSEYEEWLSKYCGQKNCPIYDSFLGQTISQSAYVSNTDFNRVLLNPDTLTEEEESIVLDNAQLNNPVEEDIELEEI